MSKITIHRLRYGHDGIRYRVLETSCPQLSETIEKLCEQIGTPNGTERISPFLLSVPSSQWIIMILVKAGNRDQANRQTLEFHALIVSCEEARRTGLNAFTLQQMQLFDSTGSQPLEIDEADFPPRDSAFEIPISWTGPNWSKSAEPDVMKCRTLGSKINEVGWSAFSFQALQPPFQYFILSQRAASPQLPETSVVHSVGALPSSQPYSPSRSRWPFVVTGGLILSILLNVGLLLQRPDPPQVSQNPPAKSGEEIRKKMEEEIRKEVEEEIWNQFDSERIISVEELEKEPGYIRLDKKLKGKIDYYINFIQTKGKPDP